MSTTTDHRAELEQREAERQEKDLKYKDSQQNPDRIVQIMPANGCVAFYEDGSRKHYSRNVIAWGLTACGTVLPLVADSGGGVYAARTRNAGLRFVGINESANPEGDQGRHG